MDVNIWLFEDFESLDVFGPVEILGKVPAYHLNYCSLRGGLITGRQGEQVMTGSVERMDDAGILLVPGGFGTRRLVDDDSFLAALRTAAEHSAFCLTVCTGSAMLAATGLLDGRSATSNKAALRWVMECGSKVCWKRHARWVSDGKYYTSSGVSAGIDMCLGYVAEKFGLETAKEIACGIEYRWDPDRDNDPFA